MIRSVSFPPVMLPAFEECVEDFGGNFSKFVRFAMEQYVRARGSSNKAVAKEHLGEALLRSRLEAARVERDLLDSEARQIEQRLEEKAEQDQMLRESGAHSLKFGTAEELVQYFRPRIIETEAAWRNLARRHNLPLKEVLAVAARAPPQTVLPRRRRSQ